MEMTEQELAYIAGLFDAEGCVHIGRQHYAHLGRKPNHVLYVQIANGNRPVLAWIKREFTGCIGSTKKGSYSPTYHLTLSARRAEKFIRAILPFLSVKKMQAEEGLRFQDKKREKPFFVDQEVLSARDETAKLISFLNQNPYLAGHSFEVRRDLQFCYAAGLIDGDGTVSISRRNPGAGRRRFSYRLEIKVGSTCEGIIDTLTRWFGGNKSPNIQSESRGHKPSWNWSAKGSDIEWLLLQLTPYVRIKSERLRVAIDFSRFIRESPRPYLGGIGGTKQIPQDAIESREDFVLKMGKARDSEMVM